MEAEEHLAKGPPLVKTPSGYVQQSPRLTVANKQLEIMGRFMAELGLSPSAPARLRLPSGPGGNDRLEVVRVIIGGPSELDTDGNHGSIGGADADDGVIVLPPKADRL